MKQFMVLSVAFLIATACKAEEKQTAPDLASCSGEAFVDQIGKSLSEIELDVPENARVIPPNSAVTQDFRPDRLNILLDEDGVIVEARCG